MAKVKVKVKKKFDVDAGAYDYGTMLDRVERKFKLTVNMTDRFKYKTSSGLLVKDLILGGGLITGAMYTTAGGEQTAKSTEVMNFLASLLEQPEHMQPKVLAYMDGEGSFDPRYFKSMLSKGGIKTTQLFGVQDSSGKYTIKPRIRYYPENRGELILDALNIMLKSLPDKELVNDHWYYVFENNRENQSRLKDKYDKKLFSKYNKYYIPTEDTGPQAVVVVDSWPSLITERADDEESKGQGLGASARMFSERLPKVKGKLRRKGVILLGVNQIREKPMAMGDPRYEPGGTALKFYSDVRIWNTARAVPDGWGKVAGGVGEEPSITGEGVDTYRYISMKAIKNKLSTPYFGGWMRIWVSDTNGKAHGIDKVYDTYQYLRTTGQIEGRLKSLSIPELNIKSITWLDFKKLILLKDKDLRVHCKKLKLKEDPKIRRFCIKQVASGKALDLMSAALKKKSGDDESE